MKIDTSPKCLFAEYEKARDYNQSIGLYETVRQNENFFVGKQWEGLVAPDLDKPVLNFLKRVVCYFVAMLVSDDVRASIEPFYTTRGGERAAAVLSQQVERVLERNHITAKNRDALRDAAVDGDACLYCYFSADTREIVVESVDNTRVLFGNPYVADLQSQPYVLLVKPTPLESVRAMAERAGLDPKKIKPDNEPAPGEPDAHGMDMTTVLIKLWKNERTKTVWFCKSTREAMLSQPTDTGYSLYPLSYMSWDKIKNSYHGQAAVTGLVPNQIAVNKLWAMALRHQHMMAFPKVFYDRMKIREWTNRVGEAVAVTGNPNDAVAQNFRAADMSAQLLEIVDRTIHYTRDFMGASDAALGNVKPDNTSAIIAVQKASSAPLELQRLAFYQFVEDYVRVIIDIICTDYGAREISYTDPSGQRVTQKLDFGAIEKDALELGVDIGAAAYWSELTQLQTLDNLFARGVITDAVTYLESIPDHCIKNKNQLLKKLKDEREQYAALLEKQQESEETRDELPVLQP